MTCSVPTRRSPGFSLLEILMAIAIVAMMAVIVIPMSVDEDRLRVRAAATVLMSDIEYAQVMNISDPKNPVVIRFNTDDDTYWLALVDSPDVPLLRPDNNRPYLIELGKGRASSASGVVLSVSNMPANTLAFNAHGGLMDINGQPVIELSLPAGSREHKSTLTVAATTGTVTESFETVNP